MSRRTQSNRDPRLFRGDLVQCLNVLQREGRITAYELSPRERGTVDVPRIVVHLPAPDDEAVAVVRDALQVIPHFAELAGEIEIEAAAVRG